MNRKELKTLFYKLGSYTGVAKATGLSTTTVRYILMSEFPKEFGRKGLKKINHKQETLCWSCKKACGKCSWSKSFKPVKGWKATPTKIRNGSGMIDSFFIHECPLFVKG